MQAYLTLVFLLLSCVPPSLGETLPWLTVRKVDLSLFPNSTRHHIIAEASSGREVQLRGACFESEEREFPPWQRSINPSDYEGACPPNNGNFQEPPLCELEAGKGKWAQDTSDLSQNDFAQARALGFNLIRLCLSWSSLEPTPGVYSAQYLDRVAQMVGWATEQGIYVILDMHEDLYTLYIQPTANETGIPGLLTPGGGQDGAPAWASITDGWPALNLLGVGNLNLAIMKAFDNFYTNRVVPGIPQGAAPGPGLQDHYIGAIASLAARFKNTSTVLGFEIINEPNPGTYLRPLVFGRDYLYPMYSRVVQAITGVRDGLPTCPPAAAATTPPPFVPGPPTCAYPSLGIEDTRHLVFAEPSALRNELDFSAEEIPAPWTTYPHIVHTPHTYTHVFSIDQEAPWVLALLNLTGKYPPSFSFAYDTAWGEANRMQASVLVTEYGCGADTDVRLVEPTMSEAERHGVPGTLWSWKSGCGTDPSSGWCRNNQSWTVYAPALPIPGAPNASLPPNGPLYPHRETMMSRVHSRGVWGETLGYGYNISDRSYVLRANVSGAQAAVSAGLVVGGGWAVGVLAALSPPSSPLTPASDFTPLYTALRGGGVGGGVTEVYLPRSLPPSAANASVVGGSAGPGVVFLGQCFWPDGSRSAYFAPTTPGVYILGVPPSSSSSSSPSPILLLGDSSTTARKDGGGPPPTTTTSPTTNIPGVPSCEVVGHNSTATAAALTIPSSLLTPQQQEVMDAKAASQASNTPTEEDIQSALAVGSAEGAGGRVLEVWMDAIAKVAEEAGYPLHY